MSTNSFEIYYLILMMQFCYKFKAILIFLYRLIYKSSRFKNPENFNESSISGK